MAKGAPGDMAGPMMAGGPQVAAAPPIDVPPPPPPQMQPPPPVQMPPQSAPRTDGLTTIRAPSGAPMTVSAADAARFQGLVNDLQAAGIRIDPAQSGGYNPRNIRGTNTPSQHASGRAVDLNWSDNPVGGRPGGADDPTAQFNVIPTDLARTLAGRHGLEWGGDWRNPDPMHFQVARGAAPAPPLQQRSITNYAGAAPQPGGMQVASTAPMVPQAQPRPAGPPQPRTVTPTDPMALRNMPRTMPGTPPSSQLWGNQNPTQRWDTLNRTFDMPAQSPDGMDHYSQTGLLPQGMQARPDPALVPPSAPGQRPPTQERPPTQAPMIASGPQKAPPGAEPWKPNWNAGMRMMAAVRPPQAQGLLPQAGIPPALPPPPRAPWKAAQGFSRFNPAFKTG